MNENNIVIKLENVSKKYKLFDDKKDRMKEALHPLKKQYHQDFYALKNINLEIKKGEILGIVGMNGSGKSTLLKIISGIIQPSEGNIYVSGHIVPMLELGSGFNPEFTGLENIYFYNSIHGYNRKQTDAILDKILDFAEIGIFINQPIKTYSSGMKARLAFAVSINIDPDILILDEVLSVGDELFRRKCFAKMEEFFKGGKTILFVSHNVQSINQMCTRAILTDKGECILQGNTKLVTMYYQKYLFNKQNDNQKLRLEIIELNKNELAKINYSESKVSIIEDNKNVKDKINTENEKDENIDIEKYHDGIRKFSNKNYIKDLLPKTTLMTGSNAIIDNNVLIDENGLIVNVLEFGKKYTMIFKTTFTDDAINVRFGVQIKTVSGVIITGANTFDYKNISFENIKKGEQYIIYWKFYCLLQQGSYFTNIFADIDNQSNPTIILDSNIFKVEIPSKLKFAGYVSLLDEIAYEKII